jgi:hypothetical protein
MAAEIPERRCIASGDVLGTDKLVRFVVDPGGIVVPDLTGALPGRGLWVRADADHVAQAVAKRLFARAAKGTANADETLTSQVEAGLAKRCGDLLGLARRAGQVVTGFENVRSAVASGRAAVLVAASDGAPGGSDKLRGMARAPPLAQSLTVGELSLALGRGNVVHAALDPGGLAQRFLTENARLQGFRGSQGAIVAN